MELVAPGSAVRHISADRDVTDYAMPPGRINIAFSIQCARKEMISYIAYKE